MDEDKEKRFLEMPASQVLASSNLPAALAYRAQAAQWDHILLRSTVGTIKLDLCNLFDPRKIKEGLEIINAAHTVEDLARLEFAKIVNGNNYSYA